MNDFYNKHLKDLRSKLANQHMSLMVGSGFSKNASLKFPTWDELLHDLVYEMHKEEVVADFLAACKKNKLRRIDKASFIKKRCSEILKKAGYLDTVSTYLKNSYPEAITTYIEERTPYIEIEDNKIILNTNGGREEMHPDSLNLHRMLIDLPWNNIYTTNYDQLLDLCIDNDKYAALTKEIRNLEDEVSGLNDEIKSMDEKILAGESTERLNLNPVLEALSSDEIPIPVEQSPELKKIKEQVDELKKQREMLRANRDVKEQQIGFKEMALSSCFNIVKEATGLKLKRNQNIIKLHGSLRSKNDRLRSTFGFDGDNKKQYVISREDYEGYPKQHEAFTQLMRISLLQESFCLIGFSGDDPNFLAWISWVRDILQRDKTDDKDRKSYKIYLIDVQTGAIGPDKQLFFENYNIIRIPIMEEEVLSVLKNDLLIDYPVVEIRNVIQTFLSYLGNHNHITPIIPVTDLSADNEWKAVWKQLGGLRLNPWKDPKLVKSSIDRLKNIKGKLVIPNLNDAFSYNQQSLLNTFSAGRRWNKREDYYSELLELLLYAVKDYYVPVKYALDATVITKMLENPVTHDETTQLLNLEESISLEVGTSEDSGLNKTLRLAFSFKFLELEKHLEVWKPAHPDILKKIGFLSVLDSDNAERLVEQELKNYENYSPELKLYILELLSYIRRSIRWQSDKKLERLIRAFEKRGFRSIHDNFEYLLNSVNNKPAKPEPYGSGRYSVNRGYRNTKDERTLYSIKYLILLIQSGFQISINRSAIISTENWYNVISAGYTYYPHAFLFYGLQIHDTNYTKRLGEDYGYNEKLDKDVLGKIALNLFKAINYSPSNYIENIHVFLSRMLISVDPQIWEAEFMIQWRQKVLQGTAFNEPHRTPINGLANFAFKYLTHSDHILEVLKDCLSVVKQKENKQVTDYLYYLNSNFFYKKLQRGKKSHRDLDVVIDQIIKGLGNSNLKNIFVLGNIYAMLSTKHKNAIKTKLHQVDFTKIPTRLWRVLLYFLGKDVDLIARAKLALLESERLWNSGIYGNKIVGGVESISLNELTWTEYSKVGLVWTDQEVRQLYKRLQASLPDLQRVTNRYDSLISFGNLVQEMRWFMDFYKEKLRFYRDYTETLAVIEGLHLEIVGFSSLEDGLISKEHSEVVWALSELNDLYAIDKAPKELIKIVLNKVLLQSEPALEASLGYLCSWTLRNKSDNQLYEIRTSLVSILRKYNKQPVADADIAFVEEQLIKIAFKLKELNVQDDIVQWWIDRAAESRFNNIKQLLLRKK